MTREEFITKLKDSLDEHIKNKDLDAWFYNWFDPKDCYGENKGINRYINSKIPGKWEMTDLEGNGTSVGEGVFWNDKYCLELHLNCWNENDGEEEYIDDYSLEGE